MALEGPRRFLLVDIITTAAIWMLLKSNLFENEKSAAAPQNLMGLLLLLATRCYWFCCCPEQLCWSPEMMIRHNDEMIGSTPKSALTAKLGFQWWFLALHKSRTLLEHHPKCRIIIFILLKVTCLVTLTLTSGFQKLAKVDLAHLVEWDFFCDFPTPWAVGWC